MTEYQRPSFTVKTGGRRPEECGHGWWDAKGNCCFCGTPRGAVLYLSEWSGSVRWPPVQPPPDGPPGVITDVDHDAGSITVSYDALTPEEKAQLRECWRFPLLPPDGA